VQRNYGFSYFSTAQFGSKGAVSGLVGPETPCIAPGLFNKFFPCKGLFLKVDISGVFVEKRD